MVPGANTTRLPEIPVRMTFMPVATPATPATVPRTISVSGSRPMRPTSTTTSPSFTFSTAQVVQSRPWWSMLMDGRRNGSGMTRRGTG